MRAIIQISFLVLALASCRNQEPAAIPEASVASPAPAATTAPAEPAMPPATPPAPAAPATAAAWVLALDGEGLRLFNSNTGASRLLAFGEDAKQSMDTLGRVLGQTPPAWVENEECRVEFARLGNGLTIWSSQSRFSGWSVTPGASAISTASGVKVGSTRADLESAYDAKIMESSLGTEFLAGGLAGLLDSAGPDAKISNLWAGETCIAR